MNTCGVPLFNIVHAAFIAPGIKRFVIEAPRIARKQKPGQFVILRLFELGERIPLTIERPIPSAAPATSSCGRPARPLTCSTCWRAGPILDVVGPLGKPCEIKNFGTVVVMGGGVGTAMAYPTAAALKRGGNRVIAIVGAHNKELVILEREMSEVSDALMITTDDGSYADKGFVTDKLRQLIDHGTHIDLVLAVGPIPMMKAVADVTRKANIRTIVSLNPIMIDGTGMCGGCRGWSTARASLPAWLARSSRCSASTSTCSCNATRFIARPSANRWPGSSRNRTTS